MIAFLWLLLGVALAQTVEPAEPADLNAQLFRPSVDARHFLWVDDSGNPRAKPWNARAVFGYALRPLVYTNYLGEVTVHLRHLGHVDLLGGARFGRARVGLHLPLYVAEGELSGVEAGLGDIGLDGRVTLFERERAALGVSLAGRAYAPTSTLRAPVGERRVYGEGQVVLDQKIGRMFLSGNFGYRVVPRTNLENVLWDDQIYFRAGGAVDLTSRHGLTVEAAAHFAYTDFGSWRGTPAELLLGGWARVGGFWVLRGAVATALSGGVGAPNVRALFSVGADPEHAISAADVTIRTVDNARVHLPDGWIEVSGRGATRGGRSETVWQLAPDTYEYVASLEGYETRKGTFEVPDSPTHKVEIVLDANGLLRVLVVDVEDRVVPGAIWMLDGVAGARLDAEGRAELRLDAGEYEVRAKAEEFIDTVERVQIQPGNTTDVKLVLEKPRVRVTRRQIEVLDNVYFEFDKAEIRPESYALLDELVEIMRAFPQIRRLRIEGHTDSRGTVAYNQDLSERRTQAVLDYLAKYGVERDRLEGEGFGKQRPILFEENEAGWAVNRRVEFEIVEWDDDAR